MVTGPAETLRLPALPGDLERVHAGLAVAGRHPDRLLGDVAARLVQAGAGRPSPTFTLRRARAAWAGAGAAGRSVCSATWRAPAKPAALPATVASRSTRPARCSGINLAPNAC